MLFDDEDASLLKKWIVKRLEDISDADSDVLADYVLALLRHEQGEDEVKRLCVEQLDDFLREHTEQFVDDVFGALAAKSFLSVNSTLTGGGLSVSIPAPRSSPPSLSSPESAREQDNGSEIRGQKRSYYDRDRDDGHYASGGGHRGSKAPRSASKWRGRGGTDTGRGGFNGQQSSLPASLPFGLPTMGTPGFSWVPPDPNDPMAAFLAAQAAAAWSAFPNPLAPPAKPIEGKVIKKVGKRCKDYDEKGFCMKGDMCPYEHGLDHIVVPGEEKQDEYDPNNSMIFTTSPTSSTAEISTRGGHRGRGNRGGRGGRGGGGRGGRSEFSLTGPSFDRSNSTLVVENIPVDKLTDAAIKEFFDKFGNILSVEINPLKHLAILMYENWDMAKKAYDSPAAIFDNRFIKVFWYKSEEAGSTNGGDQRSYSPNTGADHFERHQHHQHMPTEEPEFDIEEIKKIQEEKQKAHEEKMLKKRAAEEAAKALEKRKEELLKLQQEEKRKLMEKLAKKHSTSKSPSTTAAASATSAAGSPSGDAPQPSAEKSKADATTAALKAQLEALEAEAHALGIDSNAEEDAFDLAGFRGRGRGRGRFPRGAGGYVRGRGSYNPYYRGRGTFPARGGAPSMKLDNRPKRVAVTAADLKGEKEEDFRAYLINNGLEYEAIDPHPEKEDTQIVTFKDRRNAEKFVYSGTEIPNVGTVVLTWHNTPLPAVPKPMADDADTRMGDVESSAVEHARMHDDESYDLAEDDEGRWLPE